MAKVVGNLFDIDRSSDELASTGTALMRRLTRADANVTPKTLIAYATGSSAVYSTFRASGVSSGYTPGAGKAFVCLYGKGRATVINAATIAMQSWSTDVSFSSASAPDDPDTLIDTHGHLIKFYSATGGGAIDLTIPLLLSAGRFLGLVLNVSGASNVYFTLTGYEISTTITDMDQLP